MRKLRFGALALATLVHLPCLAQTSECVSKSDRLKALENQLEANRNPSILEGFWKDLKKTGTPIVEPISGNTTNELVTFVWHASVTAKQVFVFPQIESTSATDKMRMSRLLDTDLWYKTYCLPNDSRFTYAFYEASAIAETDHPLKHVDQLKTDQFNSRRFEFPPHDSVKDGSTVVFSLFETPRSSDRHWSIANPARQATPVETKTIASSILGAQRRVWVYDSRGKAEAGNPALLLILFDGFDYMHEIPAPTILDNLLLAKQIPNIVAVLVDDPPETRTTDLFCNDRFADFVAQELVPWTEKQYSLNATPDRTIVGGSSLGGLASACTALRHPSVFGNVLSQSGSFWWSPSGDKEAEWVAHRVASSSRVPLNWYLDVGTFEDLPAPNGLSVTNLVANRHLRDVLRARDYPVDYSEFAGGHEFVNWQSSLATGLVSLCRNIHWSQVR